jgi:hypothetical protein
MPSIKFCVFHSKHVLILVFAEYFLVVTLNEVMSKTVSKPLERMYYSYPMVEIFDVLCKIICLETIQIRNMFWL